jgi:hypothetical protein
LSTSGIVSSNVPLDYPYREVDHAIEQCLAAAAPALDDLHRRPVWATDARVGWWGPHRLSFDAAYDRAYAQLGNLRDRLLTLARSLGSSALAARYEDDLRAAHRAAAEAEHRRREREEQAATVVVPAP